MWSQNYFDTWAWNETAFTNVYTDVCVEDYDELPAMIETDVVVGFAFT